MVIRFHWRDTSTTPAVPVLLAGKGLLLCKEVSGVCGADRITAARGFCFSWCLGKGLTQRSSFRRCGGWGWRLACVTLALISVCTAGLHFSYRSGGIWLQHKWVHKFSEVVLHAEEQEHTDCDSSKCFLLLLCNRSCCVLCTLGKWGENNIFV